VKYLRKMPRSLGFAFRNILAHWLVGVQIGSVLFAKQFCNADQEP
jgi:hypothetical protein